MVSRPVRALWIEIIYIFLYLSRVTSRPVRALWIEIHIRAAAAVHNQSRPVRALWIEMLFLNNIYCCPFRRGP